MIECPGCEEHLKTIDKLEAQVMLDNAVCLCGCPPGDHENLGEDGECCGVDGHACVRVCPAVKALYQGVLVRAEKAEHQLAIAHGDLCENGHATHEECTDQCSCHGQGKSKLEVAEGRVASLEEELTNIDRVGSLVIFARDVIAEFFRDGNCVDIDGGWLQDKLIEAGLVEHPAAPVEGCGCCEEDPGECWHPVPIALRDVR